ncbi:MAG: hypothetical protein IT311_06555 [Anaerolineales bacterium]|nr:hypothetical protein [Anaerolineales bacterium]MCZ2121550.1 hypothetical protein [Anaerolineales bacterium]
MLAASDILRVAYTPDLTTGGINHALNSLAYASHPIDASFYETLRRAIANTAVELAFRRHLSQLDIPFEVHPTAPFSAAERYAVSLNGQRCDLRSYLISRREQVLALRNNPAALLSASALVPSDQHARAGHKRNDLYIFAFLAALVTASQTDLKKALAKNQPHYLAHVLPGQWRKPTHWNPLGRLALKSESEEELLIEICGQASAREMRREILSLPPKAKVNVTNTFYSIAAVHVRQIPNARIGIYCEALEEAYVIAPEAWHNLWVYGLDLFFTGYSPYVEFAQKAKPLASHSRTYQYERTRVKNLALPIAELKPLNDLFEKR